MLMVGPIGTLIPHAKLCFNVHCTLVKLKTLNHQTDRCPQQSAHSWHSRTPKSVWNKWNQYNCKSVNLKISVPISLGMFKQWQCGLWFNDPWGRQSFFVALGAARCRFYALRLRFLLLTSSSALPVPAGALISPLVGRPCSYSIARVVITRPRRLIVAKYNLNIDGRGENPFGGRRNVRIE